MEDFIFKNLYSVETDRNGIVIQELKDGRKRIINVFNYSVKIEDKNGSLLYSNTLEHSHPLIENAYYYYYWKVLKKVSKKPSFNDRVLFKLKRQKIQEKKKSCEEYYKIGFDS